MLKKESSNLFILSLTCIFFTIALISVFLYSTDKLIVDMSDITQSAYASKQENSTPADRNVHFKIVESHTNIQHTLKRGVEHYAKSAPILSYDAGDVKQKTHPLFSAVREAVTFIPKVVAVSPLMPVGKLSDAFLMMAGHSVKTVYSPK